MKRFLLLASIGLIATFASAQHDIKFCGQTEARESLFKRFPHAEVEALNANKFLENFTSEFSESRGGGAQVYIVPIVFHIIHNNGPENIDDSQVLDAVEILNRDFRKLNEDIDQVVDEFQGIAADVEVEFRLAGLDPDGNCTSGINRVVSELTYVTDSDEDEQMKELIYWPRDMYMNVWVCAEANGAAGYTNMPGDVNSVWAADEDGIVIKHEYVGSIGTSSLSHSRVLTHETGHWLNLFHTWGSSNNPGQTSNCNMSDMVNDTPETIGWSSCNLQGTSCDSGLDNVQNYMEYSYCCRMFTSGQRTRMRAALNSSIAQRNQLWQNSNLIDTGTLELVLCSAEFTSDRTSICVGDTIQFFDESYHGVTEWLWDFGDGSVFGGSDPDLHQNPLHEYNSAGNYTITLTVGNGEESIQKVWENYVSVLAPAMSAVPFSEGFESTWPDDNWFVYNQNDDLTWGIATNAFYTGSNSLHLLNYSNDLNDNTDELISATYDASMLDTVWMSYKWAYANFTNETDDRLRISVSGNCGDTWFLKKVHKGLTDLPTSPNTNLSFVPNGTGQWGSNVLTMADEQWATDMFRVKFAFIAKGGNNIYLDDINLSAVSTDGTFISNLQPVMSFHVFPNPSDGTMAVDLQFTSNENIRLELYNSLGQLCEVLHDGPIQSVSRFALENKSSGIYTLTLVTDKGLTEHRKLVFR